MDFELFLRKNRRLLIVIAGVVIFGLSAHLYRCFNSIYNHDSLEIIMGENDNNWQISLGRFFQPVYRLFRGNVASPFTINIIAFIFITLSSYLMSGMVDIKSKGLLFIFSGIMVSNSVFACENATYVNWFDICACALFLSVLSVWIFRKFKYGYLYGIIPLFVGLGLYQSYFQIATALLMILLSLDLIKGKAYKVVFRKSMAALFMIVIALILYFVISNFICDIMDLPQSQGYNSIAGVTDFSSSNPILLFLLSYGQFFAFFFFPYAENFIVCLICNAVILFFTIYMIIKSIKNSKASRQGKILSSLIMLLLPFGMNFVCFLSKGNNHLLTWYPFLVTYLLTFAMIERKYKSISHMNFSISRIINTKVDKKSAIIPFMVLFIAIDGIIFSNNLYIKKNLEYTATTSLITKISDRLEQTEGYVPGETKVMFVGKLDENPLVKKRDGFSDIYHYAIGVKYITSTPSEGSIKEYFNQVLSYPINIVKQTDDILNHDTVKTMPSYPSEESIQYIDDVLIIKLSDYKTQ